MRLGHCNDEAQYNVNSVIPGLKTFLVCGMTGIGKSTFINKVTGAQLSVSDDIHSDTVDVIEDGIPFIRIGNDFIQLVDTPGFGDSREANETVILKRISTWLAARYVSKVPVTGVLFLRPIHDVRANRLEKALMAMFKDLCGEECLDHIFLVTTRWTPDLAIKGGARELKLLTDPECFGSDGEKKVQVRRLNEKYSSEEAQLLVKSCAGLSPVAFQIQREVVDEGKTLGETQAGMRIGADLEERLSGLEEKARKASEYAAAATRRLQEAEQAKSRVEAELTREAEKARRAAEEAGSARRAAEAERERLETERKEAEERARIAEEAAEAARRAAESEREQSERERQQAEERARQAAEAAAEAQSAAESERQRWAQERTEAEERARRAMEEAENARRAVEAEKERLEKERKEAEERSKQAEEDIKAAQKEAEENNARLEKEKKELDAKLTQLTTMITQGTNREQQALTEINNLHKQVADLSKLIPQDFWQTFLNGMVQVLTFGQVKLQH